MAELELQKQLTVVKVGTEALVPSDGRQSRAFEVVARGLKQLSAEELAILITSGAIGVGMQKVGLETRPDKKELKKLQALAALGQPELMAMWQESFGDTPVGQVLVTLRELKQPRDVAIMKDTLTGVWGFGGVPIVNENDAIANEEIRFNDNDDLAARLAKKMGAKSLIYLTNTDGVMENFGRPTERTIGLISLADAKRHVAKKSSNDGKGKGGMKGKLKAAGLALDSGIEVRIGSAEIPIESLLAGNSGTRIVQ